MHIGIIGTGNVAKALAPKFISAGHEVFLASREPAARTGLPAPVTGFDALSAAELIIAATPGIRTLDTLTAIGVETLRGKVLVDPGNALDATYQLAYPTESLAVKIQAAFPETRVVKALNTYGVPVMVDPYSLSERSNSFVSGDDAEAKAMVRELYKALGWRDEDVIDLGGIASSLAQERYFSLFMALLGAFGTPNFNIAVVR